MEENQVETVEVKTAGEVSEYPENLSNMSTTQLVSAEENKVQSAKNTKLNAQNDVKKNVKQAKAPRRFKYNIKTFSAKKEDVEHGWFLVDAKDKLVGRLAASIADILRGKNKPTFTPHVDTGDYVVVINSDELAISGNKASQKKYYRHTGYPGGIKCVDFATLKKKNSPAILKKAVRGMLPKNILGSHMLKKLKVYPGNQHPHEAQAPSLVNL